MIKNNFEVWSRFEPQTLFPYLKKSGLEGNLDLINADKIIDFNSKKNILEIGPGTGRVFDYLINKGFKGNLFAVEISDKIIKYTREKYRRRIICYKKDISRDFHFNEKFDVILWMWSSFIEFSGKEKIYFLNQAHASLNNEGFLIIDLPIKKEESNVEGEEKGLGYVDTPHGRLYEKDLAKGEMKKLARKSPFQEVQTKKYETDSGRSRITYYFYKR